jgi:outer membrane protein OmpA-like peptidoglycan-associated protein
MAKIKITVLAILLFASSLLAINRQTQFELGIKAGTSTYFGDIDNQQFKFNYGGSMYWWLGSYFALGIDGQYSNFEAENGNEYFKSSLINVGPMFKFEIIPSDKINFQILFGFKYILMQPEQKDGSPAPGSAAELYSENQTAIPFGISIAPIVYNDKLAVTVEALYHYVSSDYFDDLERGDWYDSYATLNVGLAYFFGDPKDTDGDGIPDKVDADPTHPEDFDGFQDEDGAPDLDNDNDGVLDVSDKAPNDPEDLDGFEDEDGVPDPDNDKDGILDVNDKAPNEPEDFDKFEDEDGAPDPDNDNDGILDADDKCPNEPETINGYEDADGCPDKKPEIAVEVGKNIVLEGVYFMNGKATLTVNSKTILDKVVRTMKENPEIEVEIWGFTDNRGNYDFNVKLSKRRAESVRDYLMKNGIFGSRIKTKGFGPENPIAPNDTKEGRAKNRRIEFYRIK